MIQKFDQFTDIMQLRISCYFRLKKKERKNFEQDTRYLVVLADKQPTRGYPYFVP